MTLLITIAIIFIAYQVSKRDKGHLARFLTAAALQFLKIVNWGVKSLIGLAEEAQNDTNHNKNQLN